MFEESYKLLKKAIIDKNLEESFKILIGVYETAKTKTGIVRNTFRRNYADYFSWTIPSAKAIKNIKKFLYDNNCLQLLEIGAGKGLWAALLKVSLYNDNNDEIATDDFSWYRDKFETYTKITDFNWKDAIEFIKPEPESCLFLCWPPNDNSLAFDSLTNFKGNYLIYIGAIRG